MEEGTASVGRSLEALTRPGLLCALVVVIAACPVVKVNEACNNDVECSAGLRCVDGQCGAVAPPCASGQHDGGDGKCVAVGTCSPRFDRFFVDKDGDGHGAGPKSDACVTASTPPPAGFSLDDTDCDDGDVHAFRLDSFPFDDDNDGFSARVTVCGDGTKPRGALTDDAFSSTPTSGPSSPSAPPQPGSAPWQQIENITLHDGVFATTAPIPGGQSAATLHLSGFACGVVPPALKGVTIHVAAQFTEQFTASGPAHVTAAFGLDTASADVDVPFDPNAPGTPAPAAIALGGLGFADEIDPVSLCAGTVTLDLTFTPPNGGNVAIGIDTVTLDLFGVDDCDDTDATKFQPAELYGDGDGDGFGGGDATPACLGVDGAPAGDAVANLDCDDTDPNVHPGQKAFFTTASLGGLFDYDCNGVDEAQPIHTDAACSDDGNGGCAPGPPSNTTGTCGAVVVTEKCGGPPCALAPGQATQACR